MKRSKVSILFLIFLVLIIGHFSCRPDNTVGVYGGVTMTPNLMNNTMDRRDVVLYLRKDGTFTDKLKEAGWQTAVKGKFVVNGHILRLVYSERNRIEEYSIDEKGNLAKDSTVFLKMNAGNKVPEGTYRFKTTRRGPPASGQHYLGTGWGSVYYFDGKNKFSIVNTSVANTGGVAVAIPNASQNDGNGTYKLEDGTLTLSFANGKSKTHSFFATKQPSGKISAVIDGRLFFSDDTNDAPDTTFKPTDTLAQGNKVTVKQDTADMPPVSTIYQALRTANGGDEIDKIETIYSEASSIGLLIKSFLDIKNNRTRHELYQKNKLVAIEQSGVDSGWQWMKGKITPLDPERIDEIEFSRYIGLMGLRKSNSEYFLQGTVEPASHGYNITFKVNDHLFIYIVDKSFKLLGDAYKIGPIEQANEYRNFNKVGTLIFPFIEDSYRDDQKNVVTYSKFIVNEPLKTKWTVPRAPQTD